MKNIFIITALLTITILSCKEEPPVVPPEPSVVEKDTLTISVEDVTHRSITLRLKYAACLPKPYFVKTSFGKLQRRQIGKTQNTTVKLYRLFNSKTNIIAELPGEVTDTTIIDDDNGEGLLLDTTYTYYAVSYDSTGAERDTSNTITAKTLAPTTHNYTWQEYTIGDWQSALYDVWGTDENNVYAVGGVRINDTTYGVIKWDGIQWKGEKKIGGQYAVFGFSNNEVWSAGEGVYYYNGVEWKQVDAKTVNNQSIPLDTVLYNNSPYTSLWGTSSSNLYFGNQWGKIIHWDGEKGENLIDYGVYITDIDGTSATNIWITGEKPSQKNALIARYNGNAFERLDYYPQYKFPLYTVYPINEKYIYLGGNGVFSKTNGNWNIEDVDKNKGVIYKVRGEKSNNIFAVGAYSVVHHFNGVNWKFYNELYTPAGSTCESVFITGNKVFIVGRSLDFTKAKILIGEKK